MWCVCGECGVVVCGNMLVIRKSMLFYVVLLDDLLQNEFSITPKMVKLQCNWFMACKVNMPPLVKCGETDEGR